MAAFPQLGYGYKSNISHIATDEALAWWRHISDDVKTDLIVKEHPKCLNKSDLMRFALWQYYNKNPQKLFDKWIEENAGPLKLSNLNR